MKRAFFLAVGLLVALSPVQVEGQLYSGSSVPLTAQFTFVGAGDAVASTFYSPQVYVGPYEGDFVGDLVGSFSIYCVDYLSSAQSLDLANVTGLDGNHGSLANTRLNDPVKYQKAAYLASLFETYDWAANGMTKRQAWSGIHAAIWSITSNTDRDATYRTFFLGEANDNYASVNTSEWYLITNAQGADGQEFLMRRSVPEPATLLLMLTGFVMLVGVNRKRILAVQDL